MDLEAQPALSLLLGRFTVLQGMMTTPLVGPIPTNRLHGAGEWRRLAGRRGGHAGQSDDGDDDQCVRARRTNLPLITGTIIGRAAVSRLMSESGAAE